MDWPPPDSDPPRIVNGFHGTSRGSAYKIISTQRFIDSSNPGDWLSRGVYFWEEDLAQAWLWASRRHEQPAVVSAWLHLDRCLDITGRQFEELLLEAYNSVNRLASTAGRDTPTNDGDDRRLDCAVIEEACAKLGEVRTVRALFREGRPVYPGASFLDASHIQVCVRDQQCIVGRPWLAESDEA